MKRFFITSILVLFCSVVVFAGSGILEKLQQIPQISGIQKMNVEPFEEYYQFWFEQPIDHNAPSGGLSSRKFF